MKINKKHKTLIFNNKFFNCFLLGKYFSNYFNALLIQMNHNPTVS